MLDLELAPKKGCILAYFRDALLFAPYEICNGRLLCEVFDKYPPETLTECHLFDRDREYRVVRRESRQDCIRLVLTQEEEATMDPDLLYTQVIPVREEYARKGNCPDHLTIINRYDYSGNDTLVLKNYRISCEL